MPTALRTRATFGDYELLEEIARGGMGVVYRARQLSLSREVAIKLMRDGALATDQEVQRFRSEAESAAALHHPGIIAIHAVGELDGQYYLTMEFVAGRNLAEATRHGPLPVTEAVRLVALIADAIEHAHSRGVLHRDLKPSNVLLDQNDQPHVTDFGLAKRLGSSASARLDLTLTGQILGTPGYMAPEQAAGRHRDVSLLADVYSLGALLYHALTGVAPFNGETPVTVLRQIEERDPPSPRLLNPSVPVALETVCLKALAKDPHRRYQSARALADDLRRWLRHEPIEAIPATRLERGWAWARRNPAVAIFSSIIVLLLSAISAGSIVAARRIELARRAEAAGRAIAEERLRQGERLLDFLTGDLYARLDQLGRLDVLESAIAEVDRFYAKQPSHSLSPEAIRHHARARLLQGYIRGPQGRLTEARSSYDSALKLYAQAIAAQPTNQLWLHEEAQAWNSLAVWEHGNGSPAEAERAYQEALRRTSRLLHLQPDSDDWIDSHASILHNFGAFLEMVGRVDDAERTYADALARWRALLERRPGLPEVIEHLAQLYQNLAFLQDKRGRLAEAAASNQEAFHLREQLVQRDPKNMSWLSQLGDIEQNLAERHFRLGDWEEADAWVTKCRRIREQLAAHDPANELWHRRLVQAWRIAALVLSARGDDAAALTAHHHVRELTAAVANRQGLDSAWPEGLQAEEQIHLRLAKRAREANNGTAAAEHEASALQLRAERLSQSP